MQTIYLHKDDLETIQQFLASFPEKEFVQLTADSSSGIGTILTATIVGVDLNGNNVNVSKTIVDESSW